MKTSSLIVGFCLSLCIKVAACDGNLRLLVPRIPGKKNYVEAGETVEMGCSHYSDISIPVLKLRLRDRFVSTSADMRIVTTNTFFPSNEERHLVRISPVTFSDAGTYECKKVGQKEILGRLDIYVYNMTLVHALVGPNTVAAQVGCHAHYSHENPSSSEDSITRIDWFRKKMNIITKLKVDENDNITMSSSGDTLNISGIDFSNYEQVGAFVCEFQPEPGARAINYTAYINTAAGASRFEPDSISGFLGDPMEIRCKVYGYPLPQISWTLNGVPVDFSDVKSTLISPGSVANTTLVIQNLEGVDYGNYTCHVSNALGSGQATITLLQERDNTNPDRKLPTATSGKDLEAQDRDNTTPDRNLPISTSGEVLEPQDSRFANNSKKTPNMITSTGTRGCRHISYKILSVVAAVSAFFRKGGI